MKVIKPGKEHYRLSGEVCGRTLALGITSFLSPISLVAAMAAINNMLRQYGAMDVIFSQESYAQIPNPVNLSAFLLRLRKHTPLPQMRLDKNVYLR